MQGVQKDLTKRYQNQDVFICFNKAGVRGGHIPMSKNLEYEDLLIDDFTFSDNEAIKKAFTDKDIDLNKFIISLCGSGVTSSVIFSAQRIIGHFKNAVYDGSWTEYGTLPEYTDEEVEKRISEPVSQKLIPKMESLEIDKKYNWCTCGKSASVSFCDGSHRSTKFRPKKFELEGGVPKKKLICRCKNTKTPPYCDFSHVKAMANYCTGKKIFSDVTCNRS